MGYPAKIKIVQEAYALLEDWPQSRRDAAHAFALTACRAALSGEIEAETARGLFVAFARKHDLWRLIRKALSLLVERETLDAPHGGSGSDGGDENE